MILYTSHVMGACLSQSQHLVVDPSIFVIDGNYFIPTIDKNGTRAFVTIDPKSKSFNVLRSREKEKEREYESLPASLHDISDSHQR